jgi:hypothetical protein
MKQRFWHIRIKDDRGTVVRLYPDGIGVASDDRKIEKICYPTTNHLVFGSLSWQEVLGLLAPLLISLSGAILLLLVPNIPKLVTDWGSHVAIALGGPFMIWGYRAGQAQRIRSALLEHNYCPSCGYTLDGLEPQSDGCRVCPECASAWREARNVEASGPP